MTVSPIFRDDNDKFFPLLCKLYGQSGLQKAYLTLDLRDGELSADYVPEPGHHTPAYIYEGDGVRFVIDPLLTSTQVNALIREVLPLAQEALYGFDADAPDGKKLSDDANEAISAIEDICYNLQADANEDNLIEFIRSEQDIELAEFFNYEFPDEHWYSNWYTKHYEA